MEIAGKGEMRVAKAWAVAGLLLAMIGPVGGSEEKKGKKRKSEK